MGFYPPKHVAIIGAGLSGLSLALALHKFNIPSTIYEVRSADFVQGGTLMLSPNALRVLDRLGVYERIRDKGYHFNTLTFKKDQNTTTDIYYFGHKELYGYKALRVYRQIFIDELKAMLSECGIEVEHNTKFSHITSESPKAVDFAFANGTTSSTSILIRADGIHSTVRKYTYSTISPKYLGFLGVTSAIPVSSLRFPITNRQVHPLLAAISAKPGAFVLAPQKRSTAPKCSLEPKVFSLSKTEKAGMLFTLVPTKWSNRSLCLAMSNGPQREQGW